MRILPVAFLVLALCPAAQANPIKTVGTAIVNEGDTTVELRSGWSPDSESTNHDRFQTRQQFDHGFTDAYALRLTVIQDDLGNKSFQHNTIALDNRVQIFEKKNHGFDGGFRLSYYLRDGDKKPDAVEARWINHIPFGDWEFRHHVIAQHQVGQDKTSGIRPELRWQLTAPTVGHHRAGVEMFNEFGNLRDKLSFNEQSHDAGVVFTGPLWADNFRYQTGYRAGISHAATDHAVKAFASYTF